MSILKSLTLNLPWRQFHEINITFDTRLTILTGVNGSGKSTLLKMLSLLANWNPRFQAIIDQGSKEKYFADQGLVSQRGKQGIGSLFTNDGAEYYLLSPSQTQKEFAIECVLKQTQSPAHSGPNTVYVPSHKPIYRGLPLLSVSTAPPDFLQITSGQGRFNEVYRTSAEIGISGGSHTHNFALKSIIISLATFGFQAEKLITNPSHGEVYEEFEEVLRQALPKEIGFKKFLAYPHDLMLETETGVFAFDGVSGGIASVIDLCWLLYSSCRAQSQSVIVIDEPETHLHPSMQRELLPGLMKAFPEAQFIVATHSPFIITSDPKAKVYALRFNDAKKVYSEELDFNKAASPDDVLVDALGLNSIIPIWAASKLRECIDQFAESGVNKESLSKLQKQLKELGLGEHFPKAVEQVLDRTKSE